MTPWRRLCRWLTLAGYCALLGLLLAHFTSIAPPERTPVSIALALAALPLLLPLRGLLHERSYTHAWTSVLALPYFVFAVDYIAAGGRPVWLGWAELAASLVLFSGAVGYVQFRAREHRQGVGS